MTKYLKYSLSKYLNSLPFYNNLVLLEIVLNHFLPNPLNKIEPTFNLKNCLVCLIEFV